MKKIITSIVTTLLILSTMTACFSGGGGDYVAQLGDTKISTGEFMVYLMEQKKTFEEQGGSDIWEADFDGVSALEVAKQNALDSIVTVKSAVKQANSLGISLDSKDLSDVDTQTEGLLQEFSKEELDTLSLNKDKIHSILEEGAIQNKVYSYVTDNYVVNQEELKTYIDNYKKAHEGEFNDYTVREIFVQSDAEGSKDNYNKAQKAYDEIKSGKDFTAASKEAVPDWDSSSKLLDITLYGEDVLQAVYKLQKEQTAFIDATDGYYIFLLENVAPKADNGKTAELENEYTTKKKQEIYQDQINQWSGDMSVKKNDGVWNNIKMF